MNNRRDGLAIFFLMISTEGLAALLDVPNNGNVYRFIDLLINRVFFL